MPRTSTMALTNATLSWTLKLAKLGAKEALLTSKPLASAANAIAGKITHRGVAEAFELAYTPPEEAAREL